MCTSIENSSERLYKFMFERIIAGNLFSAENLCISSGLRFKNKKTGLVNFTAIVIDNILTLPC